MEVPEFKNSDFKNLMIPFFEIEEGDSILRKFGSRMNYKEFKVNLLSDGLDKNQIIRYIACVYDKESPFRSEYPDVNTRKSMAMIFLGVELDDDGAFPPDIEKVMLNKNDHVNKMIVRYGMMHRNHDYSLLIALEDDFGRKMKAIHEGSTYNFGEVDKISDKLETLHAKILSGDRSKELRDELYSFIEKDTLGLRPENMAKKLNDGVQPIAYSEVQEDFSNGTQGIQAT